MELTVADNPRMMLHCSTDWIKNNEAFDCSVKMFSPNEKPWFISVKILQHLQRQCGYEFGAKSAIFVEPNINIKINIYMNNN